jgi:endonuclease/exonuclease/phosphatase family metal-dependent hydrolase
VKHLAVLGLAALLAAACRSDRVVSPEPANPTPSGASLEASRAAAPSYRLPGTGAGGLRVMTYNVYLGTDLDPVLAATSQADFLTAAYLAYGELQQTSFPARAGRIAEQIADAQPDVVGLQEVALWSVSDPFDPTTGQGAPAVVQYDFLQLVLDSLTAHHLRYTAPSAVWTSDVAAPAPTAFDPQTGAPTAFALVRFQDRDAILVRSGVRYSDPRHGVYAASIPLDLLGTQNGLYRGWCSIDAAVDGRSFHFVNSHLEAEDAQVSYAQAQELVGLLQNVRDPVVWVGDFNADADADAPSYALATAAGFTDLWPLAHPHDPGLTNGPNDGVGALDAAGVLVPYPTLVFDKRIDLVLLRDRGRTPHPVHAAIFGTRNSDRTAAGLWPSDHAAVGMVFELPGHRDGDHRDRR